MRASVRATAWLGVLILLVGCARVDRPAPTVAATVSPAPSTAPEPTPVMTPSVAPSATLVAAGDAPQVDCAGGMMSGADIDYVPEAQGVDDILAATRNLIGVRSTDVIVAEPTVTVVVRDGRPIWRGEWRDGGRGFLLDSRLACTDTGIR